MTWHLGPMLAYDCETTGVDVESDQIVTAAVVAIEPGSEPRVRSTVINPGVEVPEAASEVHGWTTDRVRAEGAEPAAELEWIAADLAAALTEGIPLVIANAPYDLTLLDRELRRHNLPTLTDRLEGRLIGPVIDPMCIDKTLDRYRPGKRKLTDLCATYGAKITDAHDCTADALAAARVAFRLGQRAQQALADPLAVAGLYGDRRYPDRIVRGFQEFGKLTLAEVHAGQVGWYAGQAAGLADYWRREANQLESEAGRSRDDAERAAKLSDAEELRKRVHVVADAPVRWCLMTDVLNPVDIETSIRNCSDRIANGVRVCSERYDAFLKADAAYDQAFARAYMAFQGPQAEKKYSAELATADERAARDAADVAYKYADRQAKALESELRSWQSVGASVRAMYSVAGH